MESHEYAEIIEVIGSDFLVLALAFHGQHTQFVIRFNKVIVIRRDKLTII